MKKRILIWMTGFLFLSFILGFNLETSQARKNEEELYREIERFVNVVNIIKKEYVTPVENKKLIHGALKGMLSSLDPYSAFLEPEASKELQMETSGEFEGVGMEITLKDGIITVVSPIQDSPAWNAGVKPGDKIIEIDGQSTKGMNTWEAAQKLRGKKGTSVTISILREHATKIIKITLMRDVIKIKSVKSSILPENIGYIRITGFQERTSNDLEAVLKEFNNQKLAALILDLRNNPGGLLNAAIDVSEMFLPKGKTIVSIQGRRPEDKKVYVSQRSQLWEKPVVVLINNGSASASEIVTGALKDNLSICKTLGLKTFGKGSVQNLIKLDEEGTSIKLTIAYYYTPAGVRIDGKGIEPDIKAEMGEENVEIGVPEKDVQLKRAIEEVSKILMANK
ncbi:MAG: S41 family peptidase [Candidatus Omnitrophica bacterium]|nr:S41 family peptidase [Candidatus Omnitrophota bacterium]MCM8788791.1 S41 family peptidase [Candidatus Omnitrophota bacterium]